MISCNIYVTFVQTLNPQWKEEYIFRVSILLQLFSLSAELVLNKLIQLIKMIFKS